MAVTIANNTITGLAAGGLGSGVVTATNIASGAVGVSNIGTSGTPVQVVTNTYSSIWQSSTSSNSWYNAPLSASITPQSSSNRILVMMNIGAWWLQNSQAIQILRNSSSVFTGSGNTAAMMGHGIPNFTDGNHANSQMYSFIDSPGTTSSVTYQIQGYGENGGNITFNCSPSGYNNSSNGSAYMAAELSNLILIELTP
jgi:hypothetical protein